MKQALGPVFLTKVENWSQSCATSEEFGAWSSEIGLEEESRTKTDMLEPKSADVKAEAGAISYFNRDHIISVTIHDGDIVITTTAGTKITIPASASTIARFADDLANSVQSNFVAIAGEPRVIS